MSKTKIYPAPEVEELAHKIIENYHSELIEARITYSFKEGTWNKNGNVCQGDVKKLDPYVAELAQTDFGVIVNKASWISMNFNQKAALIDHLMSHCSCGEDKEGNKKWIKVNHTVEEFPSVAKRHGTYNADLEIMKNAFQEFDEKQNKDS